MDLPIVREQDRDKGTFFAGSTFAGLGLAQDIQAALRTLGVKKPSHIQASHLHTPTACMHLKGESSRAAVV
jgi:hypothetical protein